jgi:uncharacterized membrane protein HdeD (DUF308 family)
VSRQTEITNEEIAYRDALHVAPPEMADAAANRRTMMWPTIMMIWGALTTIAIIVVYTRPYQLASGVVTENGPYVVWNGELIIALLFGGTLMIAGAAARFIMTRVDRTP